MNSERAYILGLIVGAGSISGERLRLRLPYKNWGSSYSVAAEVSQDIMRMIKPVFEQQYKMQIDWQTPSSEFSDWVIESSISNELRRDLEENSLPDSGELRVEASIAKILLWNNSDHRRHFVSGLADSIGSVAPSHRRFTEDYQIMSLEFKGNNFTIVKEVCNLLRGLGCHADQILWNHPNQHSGSNPFYANWKKGFKLRVLMGDYVSETSFMMKSKVNQSRKNLSLQKKDLEKGSRCPSENINVMPKTVHIDENSDFLPKELKGQHFIHNKHICAVLGCKFAPYDQLEEHLGHVEDYINPFPIVIGGTPEYVDGILERYPIGRVKYAEEKCDLTFFIKHSNKGELFKEHNGAGYPVDEILNGINFVLAASSGELKGERTTGLRGARFQSSLMSKSYNKIKIMIPDKMTPLKITDGKFSAMVGPRNPKLYRKLVTLNGLSVKVRPLKEGDL